MGNLLHKLAARQHLVLALLSAWLILTSPWVTMLRRMRRDAGLLDYAHVGLGLLALILSITYLFDCVRAGRWRLYFPWAGGPLRAVATDLGGLLRGRLPAAEGGGLFGLIEGLTLASLVVTALTGAAWLWTQGTADALAWREHHILAARVLIGAVLAHVLTVSLHLLDFIRD